MQPARMNSCYSVRNEIDSGACETMVQSTYDNAVEGGIKEQPRHTLLPKDVPCRWHKNARAVPNPASFDTWHVRSLPLVALLESPSVVKV